MILKSKRNWATTSAILMPKKTLFSSCVVSNSVWREIFPKYMAEKTKLAKETFQEHECLPNTLFYGNDSFAKSSLAIKELFKEKHKCYGS